MSKTERAMAEQDGAHRGMAVKRFFTSQGTHPYDQIEQLLTLNYLRDRLAAYGRRNYCFYVGHVDSIPCDLRSINID